MAREAKTTSGMTILAIHAGLEKWVSVVKADENTTTHYAMQCNLFLIARMVIYALAVNHE